MRRRAHRAEQVAPRGVAVCVLADVCAKATTKGRVADEIVELLEDAGRLVVDDRTVVALGLVQIPELLPHGRGSDGCVDRIRRRLVAQVERFPRLCRGIQVCLHHRGEIGGKPLLQPQVVEPAHGDVVAEPLVRYFVEDRRLATEQLAERGALAVDEAFLVVEDRAGMLHAAKGKRRREYHVELLEGKALRRVRLQPREGACVQRKEGVELHFGGTGRTRVERHGPAVDRLGVHAPWTGREGHEVRADGIRLGEPEGERGGRIDRDQLAIGHRLPPALGGERQGDACLEVGLIEAGEQLVRVSRHEQRVQVVGVVERIVHADDAGARRRDGRAEVEGDVIVSVAQRGGSEHQVAVVHARGGRSAIRLHAGNAESPKVENDVSAAAPGEAHVRTAHQRVAARDVEVEAVAHVRQLHRAAVGEGARDARAGEAVGWAG